MMTLGILDGNEVVGSNYSPPLIYVGATHAQT